VTKITPDEVIVQNGAGRSLPAKQVFALTGYHPDFAFIESLGVKLDAQTKKPRRIGDAGKYSGLYLAGVVIEAYTARSLSRTAFHGKQIINALKS